MKKTENAVSPGYILGIPVLIGFVLTFVVMLVGALAVWMGRASVDAATPVAFTAVGVGSFAAAFLASCRASRSKFLWGLTGGAALLVCLLAVSLLWIGEPTRAVRILLVSIIALGAAAIAALLGAGRRKRKRK